MKGSARLLLELPMNPVDAKVMMCDRRLRLWSSLTSTRPGHTNASCVVQHGCNRMAWSIYMKRRSRLMAS